MKRKILSLALIAALVFALSVSAFAAAGTPSGTKEDVTTSSDDGTIMAAPAEVVEEANQPSALVTNNGLSATVWQQVSAIAPKAPEGKKLTGYTLKALEVFDYVGKPGDNTFKNVPGVKADSIVIVLHQGAKGWEVLPAKVTGEGTVVATFGDDFSPVIIMLATPTYSDVTTPENTTTSTTTVKSPQTSDIG